jgi:NAD-dependent deacetylase sirtuin 2
MSSSSDPVGYTVYKVNSNDFEGYAIEPKRNCPHVLRNEHLAAIKGSNAHELLQLCSNAFNNVKMCQEETCDVTDENWMCLACGKLYCSRYKNGHMAKHCQQVSPSDTVNQNENEEGDNCHCVAVSLSDLSFWCYKCDSYIENDSELGDFYNVLLREKSNAEDLVPNAVSPLDSNVTEEIVQEETVDKWSLLLEDNMTNYLRRLNVLAQWIRSGQVRNMIVLTGAGLSTAAGIPDFRSPGTGLYANLQKYNLPYPTAIFELDYFKKNPRPFFELTKDFISTGYKPTVAHYFIKLLADKNILLRNYTQNIDGLELLTGLDKNRIVQAHGCYDTAHCIQCRREYTLSHVKSIICTNNKNDEIQIPTCIECGSDGIIKPDIVLFGESLPDKFALSLMSDHRKCDCLLVMGTSLSVYPVASIVDAVGDNVPRILFNRERVGPFLFDHEEGRPFNSFVGHPLTIDDAVKILAEKLGWTEELNEMIEKGPIKLE